MRARANATKESGDRGMSILELIVAMGIFSIVLVVFMSAVATMAKTTVKSQATSDAADQLRNVFLRMDKEVRYASDINTPGTVSGCHVRRILGAGKRGDRGEHVRAVALRGGNGHLAAPYLDVRSAGNVTGWITMATDLRNNLAVPAQQPFVVHRAGAIGNKVYLHQRLDVYLSAGLGTDTSDSRGSELDTTFVAQNSSTASVTNPGVTKVCLTGSVQRP